MDQAPELLQSDRAKLPFACGFLRARIVLPPDSEGWSRARRSTVLIHELGHVCRGDLIGHTLSRIVCALYWFHPLVWVVWRRLCVEAERACDDAVIENEEHTDYADQLVSLARRMSKAYGQPALGMAHEAVRPAPGWPHPLWTTLWAPVLLWPLQLPWETNSPGPHGVAAADVSGRRLPLADVYG